MLLEIFEISTSSALTLLIDFMTSALPAIITFFGTVVLRVAPSDE